MSGSRGFTWLSFCLSCRNKEGPSPGLCAQDRHDRGQGEGTSSWFLLGVGRGCTNHRAFQQRLCIGAGCCGWPGTNLHTQPRGPGPRCASGPAQAPSAQPQEGAAWGPCLPGPGEWGPQPQGPVSTGLSRGSAISLVTAGYPRLPCTGAPSRRESLAASSARRAPALGSAWPYSFYLHVLLGVGSQSPSVSPAGISGSHHPAPRSRARVPTLCHFSQKPGHSCFTGAAGGPRTVLASYLSTYEGGGTSQAGPSCSVSATVPRPHDS